MIYKKICVVNNTLGFILFCMYNEKNLNDTFFIFGKDLADVLNTKRIKSVYLTANIEGNKVVALLELVRFYLIKLYLMFTTNNLTEWYGHDHLWFSELLPNKTILLEDGLMNYLDAEIKYGSMKKLVRSKFKLGLGRDDAIKKIILTSCNNNIPESIKDKVELFSLFGALLHIDENKKKLINAIFKYNDENKIENGFNVLLTQPINKCGICSELELVTIYKKLLAKYGGDFFIKKHPYDSIDYNSHGIDCDIIPGNIPSEILFMNGVRFNIAVTLYSTSVFTLNCEEAVFIGQEKFIGMLNEIR